MEEKIKVSVIVPIYNVEKYIIPCIESIINQTYKNIEIILVDDESPDKCGKIIDKYAKKDFRIKAIHKKNEGLGFARNTGIQNATGDYICFLDGDDYIQNNLIELCINKILNFKSDVVLYGIQRINDNNNVLLKIVPTSKKDVYINNEILNVILPNILGMSSNDENNINLVTSACTMLISKKIINKYNWKFVSERKIISEDAYSMLSLFKNINKVSVINEALYNYRVNLNSLTQVYREDRFDKNNIFILKSYEMCDKLNYSTNIKQSLSICYFNNIVGVMKSIVNSNFTISNKFFLLNRILENDIFQNSLNHINKSKEKMKRKLLLLFSNKKNCFMVYLLIYLNLKLKR